MPGRLEARSERKGTFATKCLGCRLAHCRPLYVPIGTGGHVLMCVAGSRMPCLTSEEARTTDHRVLRASEHTLTHTLRPCFLQSYSVWCPANPLEQLCLQYWDLNPDHHFNNATRKWEAG